jgi:S-adenosylmethionine:tRNA ribosyltransferase-isomerase
MHTEYYEVSKQAEEIINRGKREGKKIIAVGTTSVRTLETVTDENGFVKEGSGNTNIFIYPGYNFKCVDKIITNFHLPESTLIMLVSAFLGRDKTLKAYNYAVDKKYKFFSFRRCYDNILIVFLLNIKIYTKEI